MGVFTVPIKVRNWQNRYLPLDKQGEEVECMALVDSGAAELSLPTEMINRLKLEELGTVQVYTADGGQHEYRVFGIAEVEVQGRVSQVRTIELPHGAEPLLGAGCLLRKWIGTYLLYKRSLYQIRNLLKSHFCLCVEI